MTGNDIAIDTARFLGKPLDERCAICDFALGFCKRLAHFRCQDRSQVILVFQHQVIPFQQDCATLLRGFFAPFLLRLMRDLNGFGRIFRRQIGNIGDLFTRCRIVHREGLSGIHPFAAKEGPGFQKALIGELEHVLFPFFGGQYAAR